MLKKYFDCAATGYVIDLTLKQYSGLADTHWVHYNPSSISQTSRFLKNGINKYRNEVIFALGGSPQLDRLIFTSGGSEANNFAIKGWAFAIQKPGHVYLSPLEHPSVLNTVDWLYEIGFITGYTFIPINEKEGSVDIDAFEKMLERDKPNGNFLVSVMVVNNETGVLNNWVKIGALTHKYGGVYHADAVQAIGHVPIDVKSLDMLTISGHKLGIPRGAGFLYAKSGVPLTSLIHGGHQEDGLRAGTENTLDIIMLCKCVLSVCGNLNDRMVKENGLFRYLKGELDKLNIEWQLNGSDIERVWNIANITFKGINNEHLITLLDVAEGYQISAGSACNSGTKQPSHVLQAMGMDVNDISSSVRISYNYDYTREDIMKLVAAIGRTIDKIKVAGG